MIDTRGICWRIGTAVSLLVLVAARAAFAQPTAPPPLPDGYMRLPSAAVGLAPKMQVTETKSTAHVFDVLFSAGDEIVSGLTDLAIEHRITAGYLTGLGGVSSALLVWGDPEINAFKRIPVEERGELVSLVGHIAMRDGKPNLHLHAVVSFKDGSTKAGHVVEARVQPRAEITVVATAIGGAN